MSRSDQRASPTTRRSSEPQSRLAKKVSRSGKGLADTDSANGRVYPADAATREEAWLQKRISQGNLKRSKSPWKGGKADLQIADDSENSSIQRHQTLGQGSSLHCIKWWSRWGSNPRPLECDSKYAYDTTRETPNTPYDFRCLTS